MNAPVPAEAPAAPLADGVYIGLSDLVYHADAALGSTDLKAIAASPPEFWHASKLNPDREPDTDTPSRLFGRAVHKIVLEGEDAFMGAYGSTEHSGATKAGKDERAALAAAGLTAIKRDEWDRVLSAGAAIRANPFLALAFAGGLPEVSVFWTDPDTGVRLKCRQDYVKPRATVDLKSIRPDRPGPFPEACLRAISKYFYDTQAALYLRGRAAMLQHIADGAVHGGHDPAWLRGLSPDAAFVFVFYQAEGAPLTWGTKISPGNGLLFDGEKRIDEAIRTYLAYSEAFPNGVRWTNYAPLEELSDGDLPRYKFR